MIGTEQSGIEKSEFDLISSYIFDGLYSENQIYLIDEYSIMLRKMLNDPQLTSRKVKADLLLFLAKLAVQKENIKLGSNQEKQQEVNKAAASLAPKMQFWAE
jgi:hypothetical protein